MFKGNFLAASISLGVTLFSYQSDVFSAQSFDDNGIDDFRIVNWEIKDYKDVLDQSKVVGSDLIKASSIKPEVISYVVESGDNLQKILFRNGVKSVDINNLIYNTDGANKLSTLKIGQKIDIYKKTGVLEKVVLHKDIYSSVNIVRDISGSYSISDYKTPYELKDKHIVAKVDVNLSETLLRNGISTNQLSSINNAFGKSVNLDRVRAGDQLNLIIEEKVVASGETIGYGDVLAVEIMMSGVQYNSYLYKDGDVKNYYDANGESFGKSFLSHPIKNVRITSRFNMKRMHPIFKKISPHRGTDYGAPRGTPVLAISDGVVKSAKRDGGYGNKIVIEHSGGYRSLYAHLDRYNRKAGAKVKKGDVIGYVGSTGYSTGPHLHYELIVNGKHIDAVKAKTPKNVGLKGESLARFKGDVKLMAMKFEKVKSYDSGVYAVASANSVSGEFKYFE